MPEQAFGVHLNPAKPALVTLMDTIASSCWLRNSKQRMTISHALSGPMSLISAATGSEKPLVSSCQAK